jgi:hypothetical protein
MLNRLQRVIVGVCALSLLAGGAMAAEPAEDAAPVTLLTQVKGSVEYSKDGTKWKKVSRNKLLFAGVQIRSGADGSGQFINQSSGAIQQLGADTLVKISEAGAEAVSGSLSAGDGTDTALLASLQNRFTKAQRYTTVRRAVIKHEDVDLQVPREIVLSETYPELIWENPGSDYSYLLTIDKQQFPIAATQEALIRFSVPPLSAGNHSYKVELLQGNKVVFTPGRESTLHWMSSEEWQRFTAQQQSVAQQLNDDPFFSAMLLEENGLLVPALERYQRYFNENPDSNELRPIFIQLLHSLKLKEMRMAEAETYNRNLAE